MAKKAVIGTSPKDSSVDKMDRFIQREERKEQQNLRHFKEPSPAREVSLIYNRNELKIQIIDALHKSISGIIRGAIAFQNVEIISPVTK